MRSALLLAGLVATALPGSAAEGPPTALPRSNDTVSIPLDTRRTQVMVPARAHDSNSLSFLLDTGYGISMIHPYWIEPLGLRRAGRLTIVGIAGEEEAGTYEGAVFDIGGATYTPRRVASLPSESQRSRRRRDGILGAGFFRRFVVEIDSPGRTLRLYEPKTFSYSGPGEIFPLQFPKDTPVVEATIRNRTNALVTGRFEVDTGCDDCLCLGADFVSAHSLWQPADPARAGTKRGVGGGASVHHGQVPQLRLGGLTVDSPSTSFFLEGSPAGDGLAGHIGMAALRRFKVIFDYSRRRMIVEAAP
jgi:hypothetical protein